MSVTVSSIAIISRGASVVTSFSDTFQRADLSTLANPWYFAKTLYVPVPAGTWDLATAFISANQLVLTSYGVAAPATKRASWLVPTKLHNSAVWGTNQMSRLVVVSETGTGSFTGPATNISAGAEASGTNTGYFIAIRNGQWRLIRQDGLGTQTQLIAATNIGGFPATIELQCVVTGATQNTLTVLVNSIVVGTFVDNTGTIQSTGIPGIYIEAQQGAPSDFLTCSSFLGGVL